MMNNMLIFSLTRGNKAIQSFLCREIMAENIDQKISFDSRISTISFQTETGFRDPVTCNLVDSIRSLHTVWPLIAPPQVFFSIDFLSLIEDHPPKEVKQMYLIFEQNDEIIGGGVIQIKRINLNQSFNFEKEDDDQTSLLGVTKFLKAGVSRLLEMDTLICGSLLLTGEYGFFFNVEMDYEQQFQIVEKSLDKLSIEMNKLGYKISPILMKDYSEEHNFDNSELKDSKFTEFSVQPNMVMPLKEDWSDFESYAADLRSKYRVRMKRAFKKAASIFKKELSLEDMKAMNERIYSLYLETAQVAGFNLFTLPPDYFIHLKSYLGEKVKIVGYFLGEELAGYYTILYDDEFIEAHYLGFDKEKNAIHQIYLNMLFDLVREGIDCGARKIQFARTALEIKSSVGALPLNMYCYLKANKKLINLALPSVLSWFVPEEEWVERSPFKS